MQIRNIEPHVSGPQSIDFMASKHYGSKQATALLHPLPELPHKKIDTKQPLSLLAMIHMSNALFIAYFGARNQVIVDGYGY